MRDLVTYYEAKTQEILQRYGPGPRVHYHTGLIDDPECAAATDDLRAQLVASQERMLRHASAAWRLERLPFRDILDVGCGLGGGAIYWAQEFGARVTAVTIAPSHVGIVSKFAAQAGVESLVEPLLCDALTVPGENRFDAILAIDSSSSISRKPWFQCAGRLLRRGGRIFVYDCFLRRREYEQQFNSHWHAQIGTTEEYLNAARDAGLVTESIDDVSCGAVHFWSVTLAYLKKRLEQKKQMHPQHLKLSESIRVHNLVREGILEGGLRHILLSFVKD